MHQEHKNTITPNKLK